MRASAAGAVRAGLGENADMKLTVVGCGDAFGAGGRLQTCLHLESGDERLLLDCGATTLIGLERLGKDPVDIDTILITHLHGDHFSGLVWWYLHGSFVARRESPLRVIGPKGIATRFATAAEALFPGATDKSKPRVAMTFEEFSPEVPVAIGHLTVTPFKVSHPSGAPPYALRVESGDASLAFSGDTEWVEALVSCASGTDLFIADCYGFDTPGGYHMSWKIISENIDRLGAGRVMLTHMGPDMLAQRPAVTDPRILLAEDGLVVRIAKGAVVEAL
jgi:ribonuclease BN (tRNA processing enzyme)